MAVEIESCPRQWVLKNALYSEVWDQPGYPSTYSITQIRGRVIHDVLNRIIANLRSQELKHRTSVSVTVSLQELGGLSQLINISLERILSRFARNPRMVHRRDAIQRKIIDNLSHMRGQIQGLLAAALQRMNTRYSTHSKTSRSKTKSLCDGSYSEVYLQAEDCGWNGIADLITISDSEGSIAEFKSGPYSANHKGQIHVYQYLWSKDSERNPKRMPITSLSIVYPDRVLNISPLTDEELDKLGQCCPYVSA